MQQSPLAKNLKKLGLAAFVLISFIAYGFHQREGSSAVIPPSSLSNSGSSSTSTNSGGSSGTGSSSNSSSSSTTQAGTYKDGSYTGSVADAFYGNIQVRAIISGGKITDVKFLQYPNDRPNSVRINTQAMPFLTQEAVQAQSAQVDIVSGATDTSQAFVESLSSALAQAQ